MSLRGRLGRRHFDPQKQIDHIEGHGIAAYVAPCVPCPCLTAEAQFDPNCEACGGHGRFYVPGLAYTTMLLAHRESSEITYQETGLWELGLMHVTVLPDITLGPNDYVRFVDGHNVFAEVLRKDIDDTLRFRYGVKIVFIADRTTRYRPEIDYVLTPPNIITWVAGGNAPVFESNYSIRYAAFPEYLVIPDTPRFRLEHRLVQSSEVVLRLLDKISTREGIM